MAWLDGEEPSAARVHRALRRRPVMSWINLGEVAYVLERRSGQAPARDAIRRLRPSLDLELPSERRVLEAAALKARHRFAYADAFAVATALAHRATLMTGDPEIIRADPAWPVLDLR
jgi:predicted nucleic acid-binding protein